MKLSLNVGLTWPEVEDLYTVGYRGQTVGKIWFATDKLTAGEPWEWYLCIPMFLSDDTRGVARSKELALQALANSLHILLMQTPPERIERAFLLSAATGLGFELGEPMELSVEEIIEPAVILPAEAAAIELESLAAAAHAIAEPAARPSPGATPSASVKPVAKQVVAVVKKRTPTVRVKLMPFKKDAAGGGVPRPVSIAAPVNQPPFALVKDA